MGISQRLKEVLDFSGLSLRAFSIKCGLSQPTLDKQVRGLRKISTETLMSVLDAMPEISAEWLLRGKGTMLLNQGDTSQDKERLNRLVDAIATLQRNLNENAALIEELKLRNAQLENQIKTK